MVGLGLLLGAAVAARALVLARSAPPLGARAVRAGCALGLALGLGPLGAAAAAPLYGVVGGRLLPCPAEGNCISTASIRSLDKYGPPWVYAGGADQAWRALKEELARNKLLTVVEIDEGRRYARVEARSAIPPSGTDDVEFLLLPADSLIAYRSNSRENIAGVGDGGSHLNRLQTVRTRIGVTEMGADYGLDFGRQKEQLSLFNTLRSGFGFNANTPDDINFLDNSVPEPELPVPIPTAIP